VVTRDGGNPLVGISWPTHSSTTQIERKNLNVKNFVLGMIEGSLDLNSIEQIV
jgi:hypothetical protein